MRITLVQMRCEKDAVRDNLESIAAHIAGAVHDGVDVVVFPEASITGYADPLKMPTAAIDLGSRAVADFAALTQGARITAIAGLLERNPAGLPWLTQIVAREGEIVGIYRKRTIPADEAMLFTPGNESPVFGHAGVTFGVSICADIDDPTVFSDLARQGAKVVFEAAAPGLYGEQATRDWRLGFDWWRDECVQKLGAYARDNGIWIAVATQAGRTIDEDFPGGGYLFTPAGERVAATDDWSEGVLVVEIPDERLAEGE